jgi:hypothetical protein
MNAFYFNGRSAGLRFAQNKYGGWCAGCGAWVRKFGGRIEKRSGRWVVFHDESCKRELGSFQAAGQMAREQAAERYAERVLDTDGPVFNGERYE